MKNKLICGDNLDILVTLPTESVDLIYIDPPFFSNRNYEIIWGDEAEIRSFEDRWEGGINVYIDWMKQRVIELHRVLKPTGSFYLHCDWHAGHYIKVMIDETFGYKNFVNEIVWYYKGAGVSKHSFGRKHDVIFLYGKTKNRTFNVDDVRMPYSESTQQRYKTRVRNILKGKYYADKTMNPEGKIPDDVFDIPLIPAASKERMGYPTQKPEALLEKLIKASSNKDDVVLDVFCGCGTALAVAERLDRRWIGIDISPSAISLIKKRLANIPGFKTNYDTIGMPQKVDDLKSFKPYEFQYWAINEMYGTPSPKRVGDMGIDGLSFINHYPIQVKQSEGVGRNVIDNFETALRRYYKKEGMELWGYIVAFSFTKGSYEEVARVKKEHVKIILVTVQDILDKRFVISQTIDQSLFNET